MRTLTTLTAGLLLAGFCIVGPASAQTPQQVARTQAVRTIDIAKSGCLREIKTYCSRVREGQGRLAACLYAHSDRMSPKCADAVIKMGGQLQSIFAGLVDVVAACEADTARLCNGVSAGEGNLIGCLTKATASVGASCNAAIDAAGLR
jgi:hypothetical protein